MTWTDVTSFAFNDPEFFAAYIDSEMQRRHSDWHHVKGKVGELLMADPSLIDAVDLAAPEHALSQLEALYRRVVGELRKDLVAEPITAWRIWQVHEPTSVTLDESMLERMAVAHDRGENPFRGLIVPKLGSVGVGHTWSSPVIEASCQSYGMPMSVAASAASMSVKASHSAPDRNCSCGIWAMRDEDNLVRALASYGGVRPLAYGQVQMWGRVFEHTIGYRAQYARPLSVTLVGSTAKVAEQMAAFYGCEVKVGELPTAVRDAEKRVRQRQHANQLQQMRQMQAQFNAQQSWSSIHNSAFYNSAFYNAFPTMTTPAPKRWWQR